MDSFVEAIETNNSLALEKRIKEKNLDVDQYHKFIPGNYCPIYYAIRSDFPKVTKVLAEQGSELHIARSFGQKELSPLMFAAIFNKIEHIKILLANGADVNFRNNAQETVLYIASEKNKLEVVKFLLSLQDIDCEKEPGLSGDIKAAHEVTKDSLIRKMILLRKNELENRRLHSEIFELKCERVNKAIQDGENERQNLDASLKEICEKIAALSNESNEKRMRYDNVEIEIEELKIVKEALDKRKQEEKPTLLTLEEKVLECPLCLEVPRPPRKTLQCRNGHAMCSKCRKHPNMVDCPQCRVPLDDATEVRVMERIVAGTHSAFCCGDDNDC